MQPWKTLTRKVVYSQPPWLTVEHHAVELPGGRIIPDWPWITTPDYANVVAQTVEGDFLLFRQTKYGLSGVSLALVGGFVAAGEDPFAAVQRELREETGYTASDWTELGHYLVDPNRGIATGHLYLARGAQKTGDPIPDDLEDQELVRLSRSELEAALDRGEITVLAWAAGIAFALRRI